MAADRPALAPAGVAAQKDAPAGPLPDAGRPLSPSGVSVRDDEAVSAGRVGSPPLRDDWSGDGETTTSSPRRRPGFVSAVAQLYNQVVNGGSGALQGDVAVRFAQGGKTLHVHSVVMRTQTYFNQVLSSDTREGVHQELCVEDDPQIFMDVLQYIYIGHLDITVATVKDILILADKYCMDDVVRVCLQWVPANLNTDLVYELCRLNEMNLAIQPELSEIMVDSLMASRRLFFCTVRDARFKQLSLSIVQTWLSRDDLPVTSEAETLELALSWASGRPNDLKALLRAVRIQQEIELPSSLVTQLLADLQVLRRPNAPPRLQDGPMPPDPPFRVRQLDAGPDERTPYASLPVPVEDAGVSTFVLGKREYLLQEPGWSGAGTYRCRVHLAAQQWVHRERRRNLGRSESSAKIPFGEHPSMGAFSENLERVDTFSDSGSSVHSSPGLDTCTLPSTIGNLGRAFNRNRQAVQVHGVGDDADIVRHYLIAGVQFGTEKRGVSIGQPERNALYTVCPLDGKGSTATFAGGVNSVEFTLELVMDHATPGGLQRCCLSIIRGKSTVYREEFHTSDAVPVHVYIGSQNFESGSTYSVSLQWLEDDCARGGTPDRPGTRPKMVTPNISALDDLDEMDGLENEKFAVP